MGIVLWGHRSGHHGSEDWVRGLCKLLKQKPDVQSPEPAVDFRYGLGELGGLFQVPYAEACRIDARPEDVRRLRRRGVRTVLWSPYSLETCSLRQLRQYDAVVVTEKRTHRRLLRAGLGDNLYFGPEPAFLVEPVHRPRPIPPNTLALSLSYPSGACSDLFDSYRGLIRWILKETDCTVALVPYCVTPYRNDALLNRGLACSLCSDRVLVREDASGPELRGDISGCRCCVGFEGAVAAWGCGVPALCLRSNSRTLGLSRELFGGSGEAVWDYRQMQNADTLVQRFRTFLSREECHRSQLEQKLFRMQHPMEMAGIKEFA